MLSVRSSSQPRVLCSSVVLHPGVLTTTFKSFSCSRHQTIIPAMLFIVPRPPPCLRCNPVAISRTRTCRSRLVSCTEPVPVTNVVTQLKAAASIAIPPNLQIQSMCINARTVEVVITSAHDDQAPSVEDCALVSRRVGDIIEHANYLGDMPYSLNVSTPGTTDLIETPKQFQSFRGFPVRLTTRQPIKGKTQFFGSLGKRTESGMQLIVKGRVLNFDDQDVFELRLCKASELSS